LKDLTPLTDERISMTHSIPPTPAPASIKDQFDRLLSPHGIGARLSVLEVREAGLPNFSATFVYPKFRQDKILVDELCDKLINRVTSFCMTREDRRKAKSTDAKFDYETGATDALNARARKLFMEATTSSSRSGEGGELLLFILAEEYLKAPLLVSKMRLKTNTQMPVHGGDGIHAGWDSSAGALVLYIGESKLHATLNGAIRDAIKSVSELASNAGDRYHHELTLAQTYSDLDGMPAEMQAEMLRFLDPWNTEESTRRLDRYAILVGFDEVTYEQLSGTPTAKVEEKFKELYAQTIRKTMDCAQKQLEDKNISLESVDLFFFPVPSVDEFRTTFIRKLNA
jgi:hypothetical protein